MDERGAEELDRKTRKLITKVHLIQRVILSFFKCQEEKVEGV